MNLKQNINELHSNVLQHFKDCTISEKSSMNYGNYFEFVIKSNSNERKVKAIIPKKNIESKIFEWSYYSNPNDLDSHLIERVSNISKFSDDINDIFENSRFDRDYIKKV